MKTKFLLLPMLLISIKAVAGNSYIEFGQLEKVQELSVVAGAFYACSKNEKTPWPKRHAYQFMHFKIDQIVTDYFKLTYRVLASQDVSLAHRVKFIDEHRIVENQINNLQEAGLKGIQTGEITCESAAAVANKVWKFNE